MLFSLNDYEELSRDYKITVEDSKVVVDLLSKRFNELKIDCGVHQITDINSCLDALDICTIGDAEDMVELYQDCEKHLTTDNLLEVLDCVFQLPSGLYIAI